MPWLSRRTGRSWWAGSAEATDIPTFPSQFVLIQYNPDGSLDRDFGPGGIVRTNMPRDPQPFVPPANAGANALIADPDGSLVAGGNVHVGSIVPVQSWGLARYH